MWAECLFCFMRNICFGFLDESWHVICHFHSAMIHKKSKLEKSETLTKFSEYNKKFHDIKMVIFRNQTLYHSQATVG